jgi:hypothetical protein
MNLGPLTTCPACNGAVRSVASAGRFRQYRGAARELPADLAVPTCTSCGALWFDGPTTDKLTAAFEFRPAPPASARHRVPRFAIVVGKNSAGVYPISGQVSRGRFELLVRRPTVSPRNAPQPALTANDQPKQLTEVNAL